MALFDTATPVCALRGEMGSAVERVVASGSYILGPEVSAFEAEFAEYCGARHAVGVANGTDAITIALRAMGVGRETRWWCRRSRSTPLPRRSREPARRRCSATSIPRHSCVTAETVKAAITPKTKAVIAVHLFGNVAPVAEIEALGVPVLGDARAGRGLNLCGGTPGRAGQDGCFLVLSLQEPRVLRRRRDDHHIR